ncbi:MAG: Ni/Fe hydrogenase subunit alpha [Promethearchaeota archaeon]
MAKVTFDVKHIARVEGHGNLLVEVKKGKKPRVEMQITEGTRLFESFLRGHTYDEVSHIMSRICGICSQSHAVAALRGVEAAMQIEPSEETIALRKLMLIGDMLESHALHINFLALPDYLGARNVIELLPKYQEEVSRALRLKKLGNDLMGLIGGRHTHALCAVIGGFTHVPSKTQLKSMRQSLKGAIADAKDQIELLASFSEPQLIRQSQYLALKNLAEFPLHDGALTTDTGLEIPEDDYPSLIKERNVPYAHAKFSEIEGTPYFVGALPRLNVASNQLLDEAKTMMHQVGFKIPSYDSFHNNVSQAIEYLHYVEQAIVIIEELADKNLKAGTIDYKVRNGSGAAAVEAPRGLLIHDYSIDEKGKVTAANVITPTAMNYSNIEADVHALIRQLQGKSHEETELQLNMLIRAYDPCISCSVHYLQVR